MAQVPFKPAPDFESKLPYKVTTSKIPGVHLNPTPPDGFDVHKATQAELKAQGLLWSRPPTDQPSVALDIWNRCFSKNWQPKDRIVPEMEHQVGKTHHYKGKPTKTSDTNYTGSVWSGAGVNTGGPWVSVVGTWTIPTVTKPPEGQGTEGGWNSSSWVGIDGMFTTNDVLQAGVEQKVSSSGAATYIAWYEWYAPAEPGSPGYIWQTNIVNFPVAPGQTVSCSVQYVGRTAGTIAFANNTTGTHFSITLAPPPGASFNGGSCEWIMEAPDGGEPTSSLPRFTPVIFTDAIACTSGDTVAMTPGNASTMNIVNAQGETLTSVTVNGETETITFIG